jgi:hypothetical protein
MAYRPGYKLKQSREFVETILKQCFQRFHIIDNRRNRRYIQDDIDAEFGGVFTVDNIAAVISSGNLPLEFESQQPKRVIRADVPEIRRVIAEIKKKFPWLADTGEAGNRNLAKIFSWLQDNDAADGWTQHNVEIAVQVLLPELESDRDYVPPQPLQPTRPVVEQPPAEKLEPGQLSIKATQQDLKKATPAQIKDYLKRLRESQQK